MAKAGQHHNDAVDTAKPRGHETARGRNRPSQSQTSRWNDDLRERPSNEGSPRAREGDIGRSTPRDGTAPRKPSGQKDENVAPDGTFRPGEQHPEPWRHDLNPDRATGQNRGVEMLDRDPITRTAYDHKALHARLREFTDDALKQITLVPRGARLEQGATYMDLNGDRRPFTATGNMEAGPDNAYVARTSVDYDLWNRLTGVTDPERLGLANDSSVRS